MDFPSSQNERLLWLVFVEARSASKYQSPPYPGLHPPLRSGYLSCFRQDQHVAEALDPNDDWWFAHGPFFLRLRLCWNFYSGRCLLLLFAILRFFFTMMFLGKLSGHLRTSPWTKRNQSSHHELRQLLFWNHQYEYPGSTLQHRWLGAQSDLGSGEIRS